MKPYDSVLYLIPQPKNGWQKIGKNKGGIAPLNYLLAFFTKLPSALIRSAT